MTGATFVPVTGDEISINDIKPVGDTIDQGVVSIQTLDAYGSKVAAYTYMGEDMFDDDCPAGWYDDDGIVSVTFPAGTGLWVSGPNADTSITFSGAVPKSDVKIMLCRGYTATVNMMPTAVAIQDIVAEGPTVNAGVVSIQTLDAYGSKVAAYTYMGDDVFDDDCPAGWYDDDGRVTGSLSAGEGLWVSGPDTETSITIPAPEL